MTSPAPQPQPGEFVQVWQTEYSKDAVTFYLRRNYRRADGTVLAGQNESLATTQQALGALAVTNGSSADRWGDLETIQTVQRETVEDSPATPAVPEVKDDEGNVTQPAVAAVAAVTHLRFGGLPVEL